MYTSGHLCSIRRFDPPTAGLCLTRGLCAGVNRVSMGVQSFDASLLKACGRAHRYDGTRHGIHIISAVSFIDARIQATPISCLVHTSCF